MDMAAASRAVPWLLIPAESPEVGFGYLRVEEHMVAIETIKAQVGATETLLSVVHLDRVTEMLLSVVYRDRAAWDRAAAVRKLQA